MPSITQWIVLAITVVALVAPFAYRPQLDDASIDSIFAGLLAWEKPRIHEVVGAVVLAILIPASAYLVFVSKSEHALVIVTAAPMIVFICLSVVLPRKMTMAVLIPCLRFYLLAVAALSVVVNLARLFFAFRSSEIAYYYQGPMISRMQQDPVPFWIATLGTAAVLAMSLSLLREYVLLVRRRRKAPNPTVGTDAPERAGRRER